MKKIAFFTVMILTGFTFAKCKSPQKNEKVIITVDGIGFVDLNKDGKLQPYEDTRLTTEERVEDLLGRLSLEEKASLLIGTGMSNTKDDRESVKPFVVGESDFSIPGAAGTTTPLSKHGLPAIAMTDGPAGVRVAPTRANDPNTYYATGFPIGTSVACSWNVELAENIGRSMGNEALEYGSSIQLAPALNIMRNPLCGRNYEYYSEDPIISGEIAAAMANGIQSQNVGVSIKHFAANNNETNRKTIDVRVSPRALREIYLRGFEIVVKKSHPKAVMSSYNKIKGVYTSADKELLTNILREEWGFDGLVMTDWYGGYKDLSKQELTGKSIAIEQLLAGNDLLMPGIEPQKETILNALKNKSVDEKSIDVNVRRVLTMIFESPNMRHYDYSNKPDLKAHGKITREAAAEGMVLLKNNGVLPFKKTIRDIATFGMASFNFIAGGTGSGDLHRAYTVSLKEGLLNAGYRIDEDLEKTYKSHLDKEIARVKAEKENYFYTPISYHEMPLDKEIIDKKSKSSDIAIITVGRSAGEYKDNKVEKGDYYLSEEEADLITNVSNAFHKENKKVVVVLNTGCIMDITTWRDKADAILLAWFPGQEGGNSVADILKGEANPSGKLTMTIPMKYSDIPSANNFPGTPCTDPNPQYVNYQEGIYVGYRYFDAFNIKPAYEFGYGLSYTTFEIKNLRVNSKSFDGKDIEVTVDVKNTGGVAGKEVIQLYLSAPASTLDKPVKELKAFCKTKLLKPDEIQTLKMRINAKDLASFDTKSSAWIADKGVYKILIGNSSRNIHQTITFNLEKQITVEKTQNLFTAINGFADINPSR